MKRLQLLRLGLFQLAAGGVSVIFLGVVNRVMRVELGMNLLAVSLLVGGGHYIGALIAIPFGHYSDTHSWQGYRRTIYALGGALCTALLLALAPWVVTGLAQNPSLLGYGLGFGFFLLEGITTFVAGTAYLALIADLTTAQERGQAASVVWTLLMVGIITAGISAGLVLETYSFAAFVTLTLTSASLAAGLALVALVRQEKPHIATVPIAPPPPLRASLRLLMQSHQARWFAAFLTVGMFSFFMQDVILEPFGGEVFGLDPAQTARFNAYLGVGVIAGMLAGGMGLIPRLGKPRVTALGCGLMVVGFAALALCSLLNLGAGIAPTILLLGLGSGFFTVGGVALMMDMTLAEHTGLFVGTWTLVQALAKGPAAIAGGALHNLLASLGASTSQAYAGVFAFEAVGVALAIVLLSRVGIQAFQREVAEFGDLVAEVMGD